MSHLVCVCACVAAALSVLKWAHGVDLWLTGESSRREGLQNVKARVVEGRASRGDLASSATLVDHPLRRAFGPVPKIGSLRTRGTRRITSVASSCADYTDTHLSPGQECVVRSEEKPALARMNQCNLRSAMRGSCLQWADGTRASQPKTSPERDRRGGREGLHKRPTCSLTPASPPPPPPIEFHQL